LRLDPLALPVRFAVADERADERMRHVELHRERVVLHRAVSGIRMAVKVPVTDFLGVVVRLIPSADQQPDSVLVSLEHRDPALSVPLYCARDANDVVAEWQMWGRVLGMPLLTADLNGNLREVFPRMGLVRLGKPAPRRRRYNAIRRRRPSILLRRRPGIRNTIATVYRGEREIIARN
jgi:hypothetical protein